jgi:hypothetical protein
MCWGPSINSPPTMQPANNGPKPTILAANPETTQRLQSGYLTFIYFMLDSCTKIVQARAMVKYINNETEGQQTMVKTIHVTSTDDSLQERPVVPLGYSHPECDCCEAWRDMTEPIPVLLKKTLQRSIEHGVCADCINIVDLLLSK